MKEKNRKKSLKRAVIVLLCVLTAANLMTLLFSALGLRSRLRWLPCSFMTVESGSMEPEISAGDLLFVWETPYEDLQPGDIISYHSGSGYITHELIRRSGDQLVTKGSANSLEDEPIGRELYYGRVLFVLPSAGILFGYISDPVRAIFEILIIFSIFYGLSVIKYTDSLLAARAAERAGEKRSAAKSPERNLPAWKRQPLRFFACTFLSSLLAISPCMTAAKYTAKVNEYFSISSSASYFSCNMLSTGGDHYEIRGWNGSEYNISLELKNYSNTLLYNKEGKDVVYAIYLEPVCTGDYKSSDYYTLSVAPSQNASLYPYPEEFPYPVNGAGNVDLNDVSSFTDSLYTGANMPILTGGCVVSAPYVISGEDDGSTCQNFTISVNPSEDPSRTFSAGDKICFRIYAFTCPDRGFYQVLTGDYVMSVASSGTFLSDPSLVTSGGSMIVTFRVTTNLVSSSDSAARTVLLSWDASKVYLNEYEPTALNLIYNSSGSTYTAQDTDGRGKLTIKLEAFSSIELQFFKTATDTEISGNCISAAVLENGQIVEGSLADVAEAEE